MAKQGIKRRGRQQVDEASGISRPADLDVLQSLVTEMLRTDEFAAYWKNAEKTIEPLILEAKKQ